MSAKRTLVRKDIGGNTLWFNTIAGFTLHNDVPASGVRVIKVDSSVGVVNVQYALGDGSTPVMSLTYVTTPSLSGEHQQILQHVRSDFPIQEGFTDIVYNDPSDFIPSSPIPTAQALLGMTLDTDGNLLITNGTITSKFIGELQ